MELPKSDILLDSNLLIYSSNKRSIKHKRAKRIRKMAQEGEVSAVVAHQNLLELFRVLTHKKYPNPFTSTQAIEQVEQFTKFCKIIFPQYETLDLLVEVSKKHKLKGNNIFDGYLVATMITNGIKYIVTDNEKDFKKFEQINVINPFKKDPPGTTLQN